MRQVVIRTTLINLPIQVIPKSGYQLIVKLVIQPIPDGLLLLSQRIIPIMFWPEHTFRLHVMHAIRGIITLHPTLVQVVIQRITTRRPILIILQLSSLKPVPIVTHKVHGLHATWNHDSQYFPIYSGKHQGEWNTCADCHKTATNYSQFSCIDCHEHNQSDMQSKHSDVANYTWTSAACYSCHPKGRAEGG